MDITHPQLRRRQRESGKEFGTKFFRLRQISFRDPVDDHAFPLHFAEKNILPLGKLTDAVQQKFTHFLPGDLPFQKTGDLPVLKTERIQPFPCDTRIMQPADFIDHPFFKTGVHPLCDALPDDLPRVINPQGQRFRLEGKMEIFQLVILQKSRQIKSGPPAENRKFSTAGNIPDRFRRIPQEIVQIILLHDTL